MSSSAFRACKRRFVGFERGPGGFEFSGRSCVFMGLVGSNGSGVFSERVGPLEYVIFIRFDNSAASKEIEVWEGRILL